MPPVTQIVAWGDNSKNQLTIPSGLDDAVSLSAGADHVLALKADGTVIAWGANDAGQTDVPPGLSDVVAVSAGGWHSLALKADGTVVAWGDDSFRQRRIPAGLGGVVAISASKYHSLALKADGTVVAWGYDFSGSVTGAASIGGAIGIGTAPFQSFAIKADGTVTAWGFSGNGETDVPPGLQDVVAVEGGLADLLALKSDGTLATWGFGYYFGLPPGTPGMLTSVAAGEAHALAVQADGAVLAWGLNQTGETAVPAGLDRVFAIAAGGEARPQPDDSIVDTGFSLALRDATPLTGFTAWQHAHFTPAERLDPAVSGPNAISSLDGLPNLVKYALGLEPKVVVTTGLPEVTTVATDWVYTFNKPAAVTDVVYTVETSTDLSNWTTNGVTMSLVITNAGVETWQARRALAGAPNAFFRLVVTQ